MRNKNLLNALSEAARHRNITHILISEYLYDIYRASLRKDDAKKGFRYTQIHSAFIITAEWLPYDEDEHAIVAFNINRKYMNEVMSAIRSENHDNAREALYELLEKDHKEIILSLYIKDNDETARQ